MENGEGASQRLPRLRGALVIVFYTVVLRQWTMENGEDASQRLPRPRGTLVIVFYTVVLRQWTMENGDRQTKKCRVPSLQGSEA